MRKAIILLLGLAIGLGKMQAQTDGCKVPMMLLVANSDKEVPASAQEIIETRLRQALTKSGIEGGAKFSNFTLVANMLSSGKEIVAGSRPVIAVNAEMEVFVGNNFTGEKFASFTLPLAGAGNSEAKAYAAAFQKVNGRNVDLQNFLKETTQKINEYYETQLPSILALAKTYCTKNEFEEALCILSSVPPCCSKYDDVQDLMRIVWANYVEYDCAVKVNKARTIWMANQTVEGANLAGVYLAAISPDADCMGDAKALEEQIRARIGDEWEFAKEMARSEVDLKKLEIEAIRAIGVAFGENQKAKTYNDHWIVR